MALSKQVRLHAINWNCKGCRNIIQRGMNSTRKKTFVTLPKSSIKNTSYYYNYLKSAHLSSNKVKYVHHLFLVF